MREKSLKWLSLILFSVLSASLFVPSVHALEETRVFFDPPSIIDSTLQSGTFTVDLNISAVTDLFAYQADLYWDPAVLNLTSHNVGEVWIPHITFGDFLSGVYPGETYPKRFVNYTLGYCQFGETIVNMEYPGVTGSGWLATLEFTVVGYGSTDLDIATGYPLALTYLLDSNLWDIPMTPENGYFRNKYDGDIDGDKDVDYDDFLAFLASYLKTSAVPGYDREADFDFDGDTDYDDFLAFLSNYLKTFA